MPDEGDQDLRQRVENLERTVRALLDRVSALDRGEGAAVTPPPPVHPREPQPPVPAAEAARPPEAPRPPSAGGELRIGAVMPYVGAVLVLGAIFTLVGIAIRQGWITPPMQFAGELALCAASVGLGAWLARRREDYGRLLIGIGSCGAYLSFAGGFEPKHLYGGGALVVLFVLLSLANVAYSYAGATKPFFVIGMLGGLASAWLPLDKDNVTMAFVLEALILVPCALVVWRRRWSGIGPALWFAALVADLPMLNTDVASPAWRVAMLYAFTGIVLAGYAGGFVPGRWDAKAALVPVGVFAAAVLPFMAMREVACPAGSGGVFALAAAMAALGFLRVPAEAKRSLWLSAAGVALAIAPFGLVAEQAAFLYAALAVVLAALIAGSERLGARFGATLRESGWVFVAGLALFSAGAYLVAIGGLYGGVPARGTEQSMLAALVVALVAAGWSVPARVAARQVVAAVASLVAAPFFVRLFFLLAFGTVTPMPESAVVMMGVALFSALVALVAYRMRWKPLAVVAMAYFVVGLLAYPDLVEYAWLYRATGGEGMEAVVAAVLAVFGLLHTATLVRAFDQQMDAAVGWGSAFASPLATRAVFLLLAGHPLEIARPAATMAACAAAAGVVAHIAARRGWHSLCILCAAWLLGGAGHLLVYWQGQEVVRALHLAPALALLIVASLMVCRACLRAGGYANPIVGCVVALDWVLGATMCTHILTSRPIGMGHDAATSLSWTIYGAALIAIGFWRSMPLLRYWSFLVFGATVLKVVFYDLAALEASVKVIVLMALGLALLAGGYAYARLRARLAAQAEQPPPTTGPDGRDG